MFLVSNCVPRSEGEINIISADPSVPPQINFNYFSDSHDLKLMVAIQRRVLDVAANWPGEKKLGPWLVSPMLAEMHGYREGATRAMRCCKTLRCTSQRPSITCPAPAGSAVWSIRNCV